MAKACLLVPLETQLSPLGRLDSSLTFVPSLQSLFFGDQDKTSPLRVGCKLWNSFLWGSQVWVPVNTYQELFDILLFISWSLSLMESTRKNTEAELGILGNVPS